MSVSRRGQSALRSNRVPLIPVQRTSRPQQAAGRAADGQLTIDRLTELIVAHQTHLLAIAERHLPRPLRPKVDPSDLVQQTILEALQDRDQFRGDSRAVPAWLTRILKNNIASTVRAYAHTAKRRLAREVSLDRLGSEPGTFPALPPALPCPLETLVARDQQRVLRRALEQLPSKYLNAVLLRHDRGHSFAEIGLLMDVSPDAARKLACRAVNSLRAAVLLASASDHRYPGSRD